jgi:hypothetical protein
MPRQNMSGIAFSGVRRQSQTAASLFHTDNGFTAVPKKIAQLPALKRYGRHLDNNALALFLSLAEKFTFRPEGRVVTTPCGHRVRLHFGEAFVTQTELAKDSTRSRGYAYHQLKSLEKDGVVEREAVYPPGAKRAVGTIIRDRLGIVRDFLGTDVDQPVGQPLEALKSSFEQALPENLNEFSVKLPVVPKTVNFKDCIPPTHPRADKKSEARFVYSKESADQEVQLSVEVIAEKEAETKALPRPKKKSPSRYSPQKRQAAKKRQKQRRAAAAKKKPKAPKANSHSKKLPPSVQRLRQAWEQQGLHLSDRPTQGYHQGAAIQACLEAIEHAGHCQSLVQAITAYADKLRACGKLQPYAQSFLNFFLKGTYLDFLPSQIGPEDSPGNSPVDTGKNTASNDFQDLLAWFRERLEPWHHHHLAALSLDCRDDQGVIHLNASPGFKLFITCWQHRHLLAQIPQPVVWLDPDIQHCHFEQARHSKE